MAITVTNFTKTLDNTNDILLVTSVGETVDAPKRRPDDTLIAFINLTVVALLTNDKSRVLLTHLSRRTVCGVQLRLDRLVLSYPLQRLRGLNTGQLLTSLASSVRTVSTAMFGLPLLLIGTTLMVKYLNCLT